MQTSGFIYLFANINIAILKKLLIRQARDVPEDMKSEIPDLRSINE